jgi:hypothetical protein
MKRTLKININRQTLRNLTNEDVRQVAGGFTNWKCTSWGNEASHCPTCGDAPVCRDL